MELPPAEQRKVHPVSEIKLVNVVEKIQEGINL